MSKARRSFAAILALTALAAQAPAAAAARHARTAQAPVPQRFVGMNAGGPLLSSAYDLDRRQQLAMMVSSGVRSIRVAFNWAAAQPYATAQNVPAGQGGRFVDVGRSRVPTDFAATDAIVGLAARQGLTVLPVVLYAPSWDARANPGGLSTPARTAPYADYLTALIGRYGPHGTFWRNHRPRLPIREWQIWNEPNIAFYWHQPSVRGYVGLLRAAHAAIRHADPGARTVLGAITNRSWDYMDQIYRIHGARHLFDVIALDPFTWTPGGVIQILGLVRRVADQHGDARKPMLATEISWTSAHGEPCPQFSWDTTAAGQASNIATVLRMLGSSRRGLRLSGFYYYTWIADESQRTYDWNFAGLLAVRDGAVVQKAALGAFTRGALSLEGCRRTRCPRPRQ